MEKLISKPVMPDICSDQPDYNASIYNIYGKRKYKEKGME